MSRVQKAQPVYCSICYGQYDTLTESLNQKIYSCPCLTNRLIGNSCDSCIVGWVVEQAQNQILAPVVKIRCSYQKCTVYQSLQKAYMTIIQHYREVKSQPQSFEIDTLDKLMLKHYLVNQEDVRACPKDNCSYSGFIVQGYCAGNIKCLKCKHQWNDPANFSLTRKFLIELKSIVTFKSQSMTYLRNLFFEEPCPKCGVMIQKNGGCEHMNCSRCKYEFCWLCLGPFFAYRHEKTGFACPYRYVAVVGLMIAIFLMSTVKIGYSWDIIGIHLFKFYYHFGIAFLIDIQGFSFFMLGLYIYDIIQEIKRLQIQQGRRYSGIIEKKLPFWESGNRKFILCLLGIFSVVIAWCGLLYLYWVSGKPFEQMTILFFAQLFIVGGCTIVYLLTLKAIQTYKWIKEKRRVYNSQRKNTDEIKIQSIKKDD